MTEGDLDNRSQAITGNQCPLVAENQRQIICCPRNYWSQPHSCHTCSFLVLQSGIYRSPCPQGREAIGASDCGLPSRSCWMRCVCPPFSKCTTAPTCVVIAKCRDARSFTIFSGRWTPEGLPAAQHCCSEKSSQLSKQHVICFCHFVTFHIILWQFHDSFYHSSNSFYH